MSHMDLMAGPPPTHLPEDPAATELAEGNAPAAVVRRHPASPIAWAALAALAAEEGADDVTVYAYSRNARVASRTAPPVVITSSTRVTRRPATAGPSASLHVP